MPGGHSMSLYRGHSTSQTPLVVLSSRTGHQKARDAQRRLVKPRNAPNSSPAHVQHSCRLLLKAHAINGGEAAARRRRQADACTLCNTLIFGRQTGREPRIREAPGTDRRLLPCAAERCGRSPLTDEWILHPSSPLHDIGKWDNAS
jgi:hypothetical protein